MMKKTHTGLICWCNVLKCHSPHAPPHDTHTSEIDTQRGTCHTSHYAATFTQLFANDLPRCGSLHVYTRWGQDKTTPVPFHALPVLWRKVSVLDQWHHFVIYTPHNTTEHAAVWCSSFDFVLCHLMRLVSIVRLMSNYLVVSTFAQSRSIRCHYLVHSQVQLQGHWAALTFCLIFQRVRHVLHTMRQVVSYQPTVSPVQ